MNKLLLKILKGASRKKIEQIIKMSSKSQKEAIRKALKENNDRDADNYEKQKEQGSLAVKRWEREVQRVVRKVMKRKNLSSNDIALLDAHKAYFTRSHDWRKVNSSWILKVRYLKRSKTMYVRLIRGTADYAFYNVPFWVWAFLTTLPAGAGRWWWDKAIGIRFSANPDHWIKKGK
ncbi:MAG: hypothetical protein ACRC63_01210 [Metamycoplasmataceae bacterium]